MDFLFDNLYWIAPLAFGVAAISTVCIALARGRRRRKKMRRLATMYGLSFVDYSAEFSSRMRDGEADRTSQGRGVPVWVLRLLGAFFQSLAPWEMRGKYNGHPVRVYPEQRGDTKSKTVVTHISADTIKPHGFQFHISREKFIDRLQKTFGRTEIEIGDEQLDDLGFLRSEDEKKFRRLLSNQDLRTALIEALSAEKEVRVTQNHTRITRESHLESAAELRSALDRATRVARLLSN